MPSVTAWDDRATSVAREGDADGRTNQRRGLPGRSLGGTARRPGEAPRDDQVRSAPGDRDDQLPDAGIQDPRPIPRVLRRLQGPLQPVPRERAGEGCPRREADALPLGGGNDPLRVGRTAPCHAREEDREGPGPGERGPPTPLTVSACGSLPRLLGRSARLRRLGILVQIGFQPYLLVPPDS